MQVIPHVTDEIKAAFRKVADDVDVVIVEIGGTVGDIESLPFLEAIRQMRLDLGPENAIYVHLTLVPYIPTAGEHKTKPTQHSVKELLSIGIQPDILLCRSDHPIAPELKAKIALFCNVNQASVISAPDVRNYLRSADVAGGGRTRRTDFAAAAFAIWAARHVEMAGDAGETASIRKAKCASEW